MALAPFSPTILCVDDEASRLYFRTLILESQGYKVIAGTSAQEGLKLFKANQVDLVITDHLMGRATGTVMAAEMKRLKPGVPIILLSGTTDIPEGMENADVFLPKTEGPEKLLEKVQELLTRDRESSTKDGRKPEAIFSPEMGTSQALLAAIVEGSEDAVFCRQRSRDCFGTSRTAFRAFLHDKRREGHGPGTVGFTRNH